MRGIRGKISGERFDVGKQPRLVPYLHFSEPLQTRAAVAEGEADLIFGDVAQRDADGMLGAEPAFQVFAFKQEKRKTG